MCIYIYNYIIIYNSYENTINSCTRSKAKIVTFSGNKHRIFSPAPPALYVASFPGSLWERNRPWKKSHTTGISRNIVIQWSCGMPFHLKWDAYHIYGSRFFPCFFFSCFCSYLLVVFPKPQGHSVPKSERRRDTPRHIEDDPTEVETPKQKHHWNIQPLPYSKRPIYIHPTWHVRCLVV